MPVQVDTRILTFLFVTCDTKKVRVKLNTLAELGNEPLEDKPLAGKWTLPRCRI